MNPDPNPIAQPDAERSITVTVDTQPIVVEVDQINYIYCEPDLDPNGLAVLTMEDNRVLRCQETYYAVRMLLDPFEILPSVEFDERLHWEPKP